jgi:ubiquinone/menaquinone biosynthesis C-methylase UbiE
LSYKIDDSREFPSFLVYQVKMNKAELYKESNGLQRRDAKEIINEFFQSFQFKGDGSELLLDIGCGSADVLTELVQPKMPKLYKKLVGVDISKEMINYCKEKFENELTYFERLDISDNIFCSSALHCIQFDCVTSFYCFHWIQNQRFVGKFLILIVDCEILLFDSKESA